MSVRAFQPTRDFSEPEFPEPVEEEVEDDRLPPEEVARLVEAAREQGREQGYNDGHAQGVEDERAAIAAELKGKVDGLFTEMQALRSREDELFQSLETRTARLMLAFVHQLAKRLSEAEANRLAENVAKRAVEAVRGKHRITIRATEEFLRPLREALHLPTDDDAAAHRVEFEAVADAEAAPLEVAWLTGKVTFDPYGFNEAVDEVFTETLNSLMDGEGTPTSVEREDV